MPATVEFGAIQWLELPPAQTIAPAGIASSDSAGRAALAFGIQATAIQSNQVFGTTQVIPAAIALSVRSIQSGQNVGSVVVEVITEGARLNIVATHLNYKVSAKYQKRYSGHVSNRVGAGYQKRYSSYVLEHEILVAAASFVEV